MKENAEQETELKENVGKEAEANKQTYMKRAICLFSLFWLFMKQFFFLKNLGFQLVISDGIFAQAALTVFNLGHQKPYK